MSARQMSRRGEPWVSLSDASIVARLYGGRDAPMQTGSRSHLIFVAMLSGRRRAEGPNAPSDSKPAARKATREARPEYCT